MYMHTHRASILTIFIAQMKHATYVPYFFHNRVKAPTLDFSGAHIQHVGRRATGGGGGGEGGGEKGESKSEYYAGWFIGMSLLGF